MRAVKCGVDVAASEDLHCSRAPDRSICISYAIGLAEFEVDNLSVP
jgi:hypothetical protein